jgi:hypothetical protein
VGPNFQRLTAGRSLRVTGEAGRTIGSVTYEARIARARAAKAAAIEPIDVPPERSDSRVADRCVVRIPVG